MIAEKVKKMITEREVTCVVSRAGEILYAESGMGVRPLLEAARADGDMLRGSAVADKVIGRAAAVVLIKYGATEVYGEIMSSSAVTLFKRFGVEYSFDGLVPYIQNRTGDGLCPLEESVSGIEDIDDAFASLENRVARLMAAKKRTVLITGASRGIGAAAARLFAERGWNVAACYFSSEAEAGALCENTGIKIYRADVRSEAGMKAAADAAIYDFGKIDVLITSAGRLRKGLVSDMTDEDVCEVFSVNVGGTLHAVKSVLPDMLHRKSGCIITVSSIWGMVGASCESLYSASKGAVIALSKALAKELAPSGIRVNCVAPGVTETDMIGELSAFERQELSEQIPLGRFAAPEEIAGCMYYLAESDYLTGQIISPNGGFVI